MTISYKWLSEYLPVEVDVERLSKILTSIGLEVEHVQQYEEVPGGLQGLVIGEVRTTEKHPNADKLTLTTVHIGKEEALQIVCGAPNVAAGQKVVVAPVGTTIFPSQGDPITMKLAKIRGVESMGMICAEDEVGLGTFHAGIMVLPDDVVVGMPAADYFKPYTDTIFEIGLTPNRMDAMSHWGVARDVCAYLNHHDNTKLKPILPTSNFKVDKKESSITIEVENIEDCPRYSGVVINNITVGASPMWLQQKLKAIGQRPINNIVDITNYILHETGQPLHAFDADKITGHKVIVKNLPQGTPFLTLDEKERKLKAGDLMICDENGGMCIAGVFGGIGSGVTEHTKNVFLESAFFNPVSIRKTSFGHGLRTDAAARFEKGTDISATVQVAKRAALMIQEIAGGTIESDVQDVYPTPKEKLEISLRFHYLKKLSGKNYHPDAVKEILENLGFALIKEGIDELRVAVPYHKTDISLPADLVEEILRIDGLDNVPIPDSITITPSRDEALPYTLLKEKAANYLVGMGFNEILTNSITNAAYFSTEEHKAMVFMKNSLSAELNVMRNSMLETTMECVSHNLNYRNMSLRLFEIGTAYFNDGEGRYREEQRLCIAVTGDVTIPSWNQKQSRADVYYVKGIIDTIAKLTGVSVTEHSQAIQSKLQYGVEYKAGTQVIAIAGQVAPATLQVFGIKQPVYYAEVMWDKLSSLSMSNSLKIKALPKFPAVQRDISMVVPSSTFYGNMKSVIEKLNISKLKGIKLFDVFESEKLGVDKKSMAVNLTFLDDDKTLTDKEIDKMMQRITAALEAEVKADLRK